MIMLALALAYSGFAMLCIATRRHYAYHSHRVFASWVIRPAPLWLRLAGLLLILMALGYCMLAWGITIGVAAGWLVLAIAGWLVVLTATYWVGKLFYIALTCLLMALLATGIMFS